MSNTLKVGIVISVVLGLLFALSLRDNSYTDVNDLGVPTLMQDGAIRPPVVFYTSIGDTLPAETLRRMEIENVMGQKITTGGTFASYFEYHADPHKVLDALSQLPFHRSAILADTTCRKLTKGEFAIKRKYVPGYEIEQMSQFWNVSGDLQKAFECYKPPYLHTVVFDEASGQVKHRIAFIAT